MKKFTYIIATLCVVAISTAIFIGCEKENSITNKTADNKIQKAQSKLTPGEKAQIAGADLTGLLTGAGIGSGVGNAIGGPVGAGIGATIGGVVGGTAASLSKWGQIKDSHDSLAKGISQSNMANMHSEAGNDDNPYDSVGLIHYQLMNHFFENEYLFQLNSVFNDSTYYVNAITLFPQYYNLNITNYSQYFPFLEFTNALDESNSFSFSELLNNYIENEDLRTTILNYDQERLNSTSFSNFYNYSIDIEDEVCNNTNINDMDKQIALSYMATARYGYWYWILIYDNE
ncbi:MAG: hypothetical protein KBA86_09310 [Bacteroidales bacterium]|nr:hypothetical protein [Bacteroidales bacterium]